VRAALPIALAATAAGCLLAGCGGHSSATRVPANETGTVGADLGALHIRGTYVPAQSSTDVAAAYFSVTNTGGSGDALVSASTPVAMSVGLHDTVGEGSADEMVDVGALTVPAHATAVLHVGGEHLMLMAPVHILRQGQTVPLTLVFRHAGTVHLVVPVVAATGPQGAAGGS